MFYVVGYNMPGYLPEMEPYAVETAYAAKQAMIDELLRSADQQSEIDDENGANELAFLAEDLNLTNVEDGWGVICAGISYWIEAQPGNIEQDGDYPV